MPSSREVRFYARQPGGDPLLVAYCDYCDAIGQEPNLREYLQWCVERGLEQKAARPAPNREQRRRQRET